MKLDVEIPDIDISDPVRMEDGQYRVCVQFPRTIRGEIPMARKDGKPGTTMRRVRGLRAFFTGNSPDHAFSNAKSVVDIATMAHISSVMGIKRRVGISRLKRLNRSLTD